MIDLMIQIIIDENFMKKKRFIYPLCLGLTSLLLCTSAVYAATLTADSLRVGKQGTGGVTYFNGTIINETTGAGGANNPVTFGDNVRIDGTVYRGATAGTSDAMPFKINDNLEVAGSLTIGSLASSGVVATANLADSSITTEKIADGAVVSADLANNAVTSIKIFDGTVTTGDILDATIATADISDNAITSAKINDGAIATADLADSSITPAKINGTGGANLPIAYGYCDQAGNMLGGTSNVTCFWNQAQGAYNITIEGESYIFNQYITVATTVINDYFASVYSHSGILDVYITNANGMGGLQSDFSFIIYKI